MIVCVARKKNPMGISNDYFFHEVKQWKEWQKQKYYFFRVAESKDTLICNIEDNLKMFPRERAQCQEWEEEHTNRIGHIWAWPVEETGTKVQVEARDPT